MATTSDIVDDALGGVAQYRALLRVVARDLAQRFPDPDLRPLFQAMPKKAIGPVLMALCDRIAGDLGEEAPANLLQAVGALAFHLSTHDDIVDERPSERRAVGALLYAGNITALDGLQRLQAIGRSDVTDAIVRTIARNHAAQQRVLRLLWEQSPASFDDYRRGLEHSTHLVGIGVHTGLAWARRSDLEARCRPFCEAYGLAFQLIDDLIEVDQDRQSGYHSYAVVEGPPYVESRRWLVAALQEAGAALESTWTETRDLVARLQRVAHAVLRAHVAET